MTDKSTILDHPSMLATLQWGDDEVIELRVPQFEFSNGKRGFRIGENVLVDGRKLAITISINDPSTADPVKVAAKQALTEAKELGKAALYTKMALQDIGMAHNQK